MVSGSGEPLGAPLQEYFICSADGSRWPYLMQLPCDEPRAVLVYLHGHYADQQQGMSPGIYGDAFGKLRRECLRRGWAYITAWYGGNTWMGPVAESGVADLIRILRQRWPGRQVYLCGGSMGGSSALVFATARPGLVDGLIALCPAAVIEGYYALASSSEDPTLRSISAAIRIHYRADGHDLAQELRKRSALRNAEHLTMPVYLSHGANDALIPVEPTRALAVRLKELGRRLLYREIPGGDHDAPLVQVDWEEALGFVAGEKAEN